MYDLALHLRIHWAAPVPGPDRGASLSQPHKLARVLKAGLAVANLGAAWHPARAHPGGVGADALERYDVAVHEVVGVRIVPSHDLRLPREVLEPARM